MINIIGLQTLYKKDTKRFLRVYNQTIIAPILNALLFFTIFVVAIPHNDSSNYNQFLIAGLIIMSAINGAYNNGIFIVASKTTGNIIDLITAPFTPNEIILGLSAGSVTRAFVIAVLIYLSLSIFQGEFLMFNLLIAIVYLIVSSLICALIGLLGGLIFNNFEESSFITNYFITPLLFLSGTFYSIKKLPIIFQNLIKFNPFFYMIDGFRYGILGINESPLWIGLLVMLGMSGALWFTCYKILKTGYRLKK